jgi:hypothetical protein
VSDHFIVVGLQCTRSEIARVAMAPTTSGRKRDRLRKWLSSGTVPSGTPVSSPVSISTSQPRSLGTSTTTQQGFQARVFCLLSSDTRDVIQRHSVTITNDVDALIQRALVATRQKQAICQAKRWTFPFRGHTVVLREKADNIVKWLDRFKQVGDIASNADPVHVGLPWAGIRLLLEVGMKHIRKDGISGVPLMYIGRSF